MDPGALRDRVQVAYGRAFNPFATTSWSVTWNKRRDSGRTAAYFKKVVVPDTHDLSSPGTSERKTKGTEGPVTNLFTIQMIAPSSMMPLGPIVMSPWLASTLLGPQLASQMQSTSQQHTWIQEIYGSEADDNSDIPQEPAPFILHPGSDTVISRRDCREWRYGDICIRKVTVDDEWNELGDCRGDR